ncbi:hypothetical protein [Desulfonema magnum]|uniref:Uncharacterized protein n=1 Tax=Desulfonema magnum TaxID=45655 RepID=A0A975GUM9_9BACT|nr:hypothetical protein [Desulfonema magnum]QTA93118.1 Uncharacterized protein dnm_092150 [Desulfonema magnum]
MATNFRILSHRKRNNLHLKLTGDFDGSSAYELINKLEANCGSVVRIFIHTGSLKTIYPFGQKVFQNKLSVPSSEVSKLIFTGENGDKISPEKDRSL